jgi:hypothetical protein
MAKGITTRDIIGKAGTEIALQGAYHADVTSGWIDIRNISKVNVNVRYTQGAAEAGNIVHLKAEYADPLNSNKSNSAITTTDIVQNTNVAETAGVDAVTLEEKQFTAVAAPATYDAFTFEVPARGKWIRIAAKESGVAANAGNVHVRLILEESENDV